MSSIKWLFRKIVIKICTYLYLIKFSLLYLLYAIFHPFESRDSKTRSVPKCLKDSVYGEHKYAKVNGIKIHYVEKGSHEKPLMVFVHGFPEFWYSWRHQMTEFSKDYWCVALDMRGYGESDKPSNLSDYRVNHLADDIKELVSYLGREKFTLVGHDWGGVVSMYFVDKYSHMLENYIILSSTCLSVWNNLVMTEWWQFRHSWYVFFFLNPILPELVLRMNNLQTFDRAMKSNDPEAKITEDDIEAFKYTYSADDAFTCPMNYYRANFDNDISIKPPEKLPKGLYVLGEFEEYLSLSNIVGVMKRYNGLEAKILRNGRHFIQQEKPDSVNEMIRNFLRKGI